MIVVADTSPINYLVQIEQEFILSALYKRVLIPKAVLTELHHPAAPSAVKNWLSHIPAWVEVCSLVASPDPALASLDPGEREAIQVAQEQRADLVLIDERRGRLEARRRGLATTGTIGILVASGEMGLTDPLILYRRLISETNFRIAPQLEQSILAKFRTIR